MLVITMLLTMTSVKMVPVKTLGNTTELCWWGLLQQKLSFKNSFCHRLVKDLLIQCGDITTGDGTGCELLTVSHPLCLCLSVCLSVCLSWMPYINFYHLAKTASFLFIQYINSLSLSLCLSVSLFHECHIWIFTTSHYRSFSFHFVHKFSLSLTHELLHEFLPSRKNSKQLYLFIFIHTLSLFLPFTLCKTFDRQGNLGTLR